MTGRSSFGHGRASASDSVPLSREAVYVPACANSMFGPAGGGEGVQRSLEELCERAGVSVLVPTDIDSLSCGTPWSSKGLPDRAAVMRKRVLASLRGHPERRAPDRLRRVILHRRASAHH